MAGSVKKEDGLKREVALRFLSRPREIDKAIRRKKEQIEDLRSSLTSISVSYSDMPKGGSGPGSRIEDGIVRLMGLEEEVARLEKEKASVVEEIMDYISMLPELDEQRVITELYLLDKSWETAIKSVGCSRGRFQELRIKALDGLGNRLNASGLF